MCQSASQQKRSVLIPNGFCFLSCYTRAASIDTIKHEDMLSTKPALESHLVKHLPFPHSDRVIPFAECHHPLSATSSGSLSK